ncbi:AEC family transporter [Desulfonatronovibrio hydrogenovorans]|uniref:AEC family transporter n=1 Tax=Desulfonatronovibrio hydrogenovorans TaxID=53245 RepID=UPI00068C7FC0|nr:AEC family transporter [Desulfonatronovibrio hydrogenovorans]
MDLNSVFLALSPIFILILMGWVFQRIGFPGSSFWPMAERITYYVFFPALLFFSLYSADFSQTRFWSMALAVSVPMLATSLIMLLLRPVFRVSEADFSSLFQGGLRPNTYVGISAAFVFLGAEGLALAAMVIAVMIPLANFISVAVVTRFGNNQSKGWKKAFISLVSNPLILACFLGIGVNLSGLRLVLGTEEVVRILSQASLSLGLLAVGAGLEFRGIASKWRPILWSSVFKLVLLPLLMGLMSVWVGLDQPSILVVVVFASLPCGAAAFVMARQLGGGLDMMAAIITVQTVVAAGSMPLLIGLFS